MSFYIRKSLSVGPFRFNLSKSGVGISAGVTGFRIGSGPRGNYVHMGRGGLYYRASLPTGPSSLTQTTPASPAPQPRSGSSTELSEIHSGATSEMVDSSSASLLDELNSKNRLVRICPWVVGLGLLLSFLLYIKDGAPWLLGLALVATGIGAALAYQKDVLRKSVVLFYDLEQEPENAFERVCNGFDQLVGARKVWHIQASGNVRDRKYEAGASKLVNRNSIILAKAVPPYVQTNITVPAIRSSRTGLYFFPDRLLVYGPEGVGAVGYKDLSIEVSSGRFIENDGVPSDSQVVGQTWQYVNKGGGPDKRFKDNKQIPIALYEEIHFKSSTGLNELIQVSRVGFGAEFREAIQGLIVSHTERAMLSGNQPNPSSRVERAEVAPPLALGQTVPARRQDPVPATSNSQTNKSKIGGGEDGQPQTTRPVGLPLDWKSSKPHLLLLSRFLHAQNRNDVMAPYWDSVLGESPKLAVDRFIAQGLLVPASLTAQLDAAFKVADLKLMLKERGLLVSGKKAALIERLMATGPSELSAKVAHLDIVECSTAARAIADRYVLEMKAERDAAVAESLTFLRDRNFRDASLTVSRYEARQVFARGLGIDWSKKDPADDVRLLKTMFLSRPKILAGLPDDEWEALGVAAGMMHLWGTNTADEWLPEGFVGVPQFDVSTAARMMEFHANYVRDMERFRGMRVKKATILGCGDASCAECRKIANKSMLLDEVPELPHAACTHEMGCRCLAQPDFT